MRNEQKSLRDLYEFVISLTMDDFRFNFNCAGYLYFDVVGCVPRTLR